MLFRNPSRQLLYKNSFNSSFLLSSSQYTTKRVKTAPNHPAKRKESRIHGKSELYLQSSWQSVCFRDKTAVALQDTVLDSRPFPSQYQHCSDIPLTPSAAYYISAWTICPKFISSLNKSYT